MLANTHIGENTILFFMIFENIVVILYCALYLSGIVFLLRFKSRYFTFVGILFSLPYVLSMLFLSYIYILELCGLYSK